ncbi:CheR family methyltransferase [Thiorhodospira sibirica]|uniref:CheR family methyltransferase n=1 Tax=Thiorhodospira sibirica TaxID=154347 RepID=UPI00022C4C95|nr:protein-glutamate O-methyltransferase CheR [Thiorhodospira sibirica]
MSSTPIQPQEYEAFRLFLEKSCGLVLGDNKHYLVTSRLSRLLSEFSVHSVSELLRMVQEDRGGKLRTRVIEAMTTNETYWFRDVFPYEILKSRVFPDLLKRGGGLIRIWCAACSTGQEPYSISMSAAEYPQRLNLQITGTDISAAVLREAREASYDNLAVGRGLSMERRQRFFSEKDGRWLLNADVKAKVSFREFNLLDSYSLLGRFDIIFCRNVLIYFSTDSKQDILRRMANALNPGGYLFLGASESIGAVSDMFEIIRCNPGVVYKRR